jgi:uncharacterized phage-associated protein
MGLTIRLVGKGRSMPTADEVARFFLHLASKGERVPLTQMHLHKLLYYAQGEACARLRRPLFAEAIEAWRHGPVIASLYATFRVYGKDAILFSEARDGSFMSAEDREIVEAVWRRLRGYSAHKLRFRTHQEAPWRNARGNRPDDARSRERIPLRAMFEHFAPDHVAWCRARGVDPEQLAVELDLAKRGEVVNIDLATMRAVDASRLPPQRAAVA